MANAFEVVRSFGSDYLRGGVFLIKALVVGTAIGIAVGVADAVGDSIAEEEIVISERNVSLGIWSGVPILFLLNFLKKKGRK